LIRGAEYSAIARHYGDRTARRSGVPLIRHIDHGLAILAALGSTDRAMRAFCIHPLVQDDETLGAAVLTELTSDVHVMALAIEYRSVANAALSTRPLASAADIRLSPLAEVNDMLIADKVQNRADFLRHHAATHPRSTELDRYFRLWLERLGIDESWYATLAGLVAA
jgi:(p)ppGpp synthase/HD superfamily hydrolase